MRPMTAMQRPPRLPDPASMCAAARIRDVQGRAGPHRPQRASPSGHRRVLPTGHPPRGCHRLTGCVAQRESADSARASEQCRLGRRLERALDSRLGRWLGRPPAEREASGRPPLLSGGGATSSDRAGEYVGGCTQSHDARFCAADKSGVKLGAEYDEDSAVESGERGERRRELAWGEFPDREGI